MSVFQSLGEEHKAMRSLAHRLEDVLGLEDPHQAYRESRNLLLVLLHALDGHERFENEVFAKPLRGDGHSRRWACRAIAREHSVIDHLRQEAVALLECDRNDEICILQPVMGKFLDELERHFLFEEKELWPRLNEVGSRSVRHRVDREATRQLKEFKKDVSNYWQAVDQYLGSSA